jgi:hypothetical protein
MERNSRIRFVSTGGEIPGHDESTYGELVERVQCSRFADRFDLRGWLIADELPAVVAGADLGVLTEKPIYEGMLGSKNRIVQWMSSGLAVAYNEIGDLGELLRRHRSASPFRSVMPRRWPTDLLGGRAPAGGGSHGGSGQPVRPRAPQFRGDDARASRLGGESDVRPRPRLPPWRAQGGDRSGHCALSQGAPKAK